MNAGRPNGPPLFSRRAVLAAGAVSAMIPAAAGLEPAIAAAGDAQQSRPIVETRGGKLRGSSSDGVMVFKGIRYGEDTAARRFRQAVPARGWSGIREATEFGAQSPQLMLAIPGMALLADMYRAQPQSEDCLFLNVWAPAAPSVAKRPVMVWLHGGGFVAGSGASPTNDGTRLCQRGDVIVVSLNHRLGAFGYLYLGGIYGQRYADSGNVGNLDIILALKWVRDNIEAFGGDPGNVTIFGESGGGYKVSALMAMPAAKGLFHRAIVQSGPLIFAHQPDAATAYSKRFEAAMGAQVDRRLETMPMEDITGKLQAAVGTLGWHFGPVIDGVNLTRDPFAPDAPPDSRDVPLLIGSNKDEAALTADAAVFALTTDALPGRLQAIYPARSGPELAAGLRTAYPFARPGELYIAAASWAMMRNNAIVQAERKADGGGAPAFMYLLAWETPVDGGKWKAPHALDLPLVFDNVATTASMVGRDSQAQRVADAMSVAWIAFARSGDPGWAPYEPDRRMTMVFNETSAVVADPEAEVRKLLSGPPTPSPAG